MNALCILSLNVALHFRDTLNLIPEIWRGAKLIVESLVITSGDDNSSTVTVQVDGKELVFENVTPTTTVEGSSANIGLILSKLGACPVIAAPIGRDAFGQQIAAYLNEQKGVTFKPFWYDGPTAVTAAVTDSEGLTTLFCCKPPAVVTPEMVDDGLRKLTSAPLYVIATSVRTDQIPAVVTAYELFPNAVRTLIPHQGLLSAQRHQPTDEFRQLLAGVGIFQVNEREAHTLHKGIERPEPFTEADLREMDEWLRDLGCRPHITAVTLGERGAATVAFRNGTSEVLSHDAHEVDAAVDTTGCGDAFMAALIRAHSLGRGHRACVNFACRVAAENVRGSGGSFAQVDELLIKAYPH